MKKAIALILCAVSLIAYSAFPIMAENAHERFTDVKPGKWYYKPIMEIVSRGYACGTSETSFSPEKPITREEAVAILIKVLNRGESISSLYTPKGNVFVDAPLGKWYTPYIEIAYRLGIVSGISNDTFGVGLPISRQDFAVMIRKTFFDGVEIEGYLPNELSRKFKDADQISDYAAEALGDLCGFNAVSVGETHASLSSFRPVFSGYEGYLRPRDTITRAEAAAAVRTAYITNQTFGVIYNLKAISYWFED